MPLPLAAIGLGISAVGALTKGIHGAFQNAKANKIDRNNQLPQQQVQGEYFKNVADAEALARGGMPSQQYSNSLNNISRNMAGGLRRFGRGQSLASMVRAGNDATLQLDANDAGQRIRNRMNLFQQRNILAGQKNSVFDWNKKQPYIANLQKAEALRGAGTQNLMNSFNDLSQGGMMLAANSEGGGDTGMAGKNSTMDGNFTPNSFWNTMRGRNRQQYIGPMAGQTGISK